MTKRDKILICLGRFNKKYGYAPTIEELNKSLRWQSAELVYQYLLLLKEEGVIWYEPGKSRSAWLKIPTPCLKPDKIPT